MGPLPLCGARRCEEDWARELDQAFPVITELAYKVHRQGVLYSPGGEGLEADTRELVGEGYVLAA